MWGLILCLFIAPPLVSANSLGFRGYFEIRGFVEEEIGKNVISILDVGSGFGDFLPKIEQYFKDYGFHVAEIVGIDNGSFLAEDTPMSKKREVVERDLGADHRVKFMDYREASTVYEAHFDLAFVSSPFPHNYRSDRAYIFHSMKMLQENGILFLRFYRGERENARTTNLIQYCQKQGWHVAAGNTLLPDTFFSPEPYTFIIKRTPFEGEVVAESLGKLATQVFALQKYEMAA